MLAGCLHALLLLARLRPRVVFAKGSYVSVPPVVAARLLGIPVITHESDATPALATRINASMAHTVLVAFAATRGQLPARLRRRVRVTGNPLRAGLEQGDAERGRARVGAPSGVPLLFVTGGSSGAGRSTSWSTMPCRSWFGIGSWCIRPERRGALRLPHRRRRWPAAIVPCRS